MRVVHRSGLVALATLDRRLWRTRIIIWNNFSEKYDKKSAKPYDI